MARTKDKKVWPLTIFLIKPGLSQKDALADREDLLEIPVRHGKRSIGRLVVKRPQDSAPTWARLFEGHADLRGLGLRNRSTAAVLFTRRGGSLFALTFGYGRHLLEPGTWVENFGLKTTLNMVESDKIRSIDRKRFDELTTLTREQASRAGSVEQFGLDMEKDVLRALVGTPRDRKLGQSVAGLDALVARVECELKDLPRLLTTYGNEYRKRAYRRSFRWVDQIGEVRDASLVEGLDEDLVSALDARKPATCWMCAPEPLDWGLVAGFRYVWSRASRGVEG